VEVDEIIEYGVRRKRSCLNSVAALLLPAALATVFSGCTAGTVLGQSGESERCCRWCPIAFIRRPVRSQMVLPVQAGISSSAANNTEIVQKFLFVKLQREAGKGLWAAGTASSSGSGTARRFRPST